MAIDQLKSTGDKVLCLQFADDAVLCANSSSSCQALCHQTDTFLKWSGLEAKVPKCRSIAYHSRPKAEFYDSGLQLAEETIPWVGDSELYFLGLPVDPSLSTKPVRESLVNKLKSLCENSGLFAIEVDIQNDYVQ